jgi:hypothetical protein
MLCCMIVLATQSLRAEPFRSVQLAAKSEKGLDAMKIANLLR